MVMEKYLAKIMMIFIFLCGYLFLGIVAIIIVFIAINIWISSVILILGTAYFYTN